MNAVGLIIYTVTDVEKAKNFYRTLLGVDPYVDGKPYTGFKIGEMEIGLVSQAPGNAPPAGLAYVTVADINAALESLLEAGAQKVQDVKDVGYGMLVASVKDLDGTSIGLRQFPAK